VNLLGTPINDFLLMNRAAATFSLHTSGVLEKVAGGNNVAQRAFKWAMDVAEERREALDTGVK
jgi:hypothetical protein